MVNLKDNFIILILRDSNSVLFSSNGFFQRHLLIPNMPHSFQLDKVALAGSLSGVVMAGVNCPVELIKVRLQVQDHNNRVQKIICLTVIESFMFLCLEV